MNGLRILSKRSLNAHVGHVGSATTGHNLRSLGSKTSTYSLFCLAIASDIKADLRIFGKPKIKLKNLLSNLFRAWLKYFRFSGLVFLFCSLP